MYYQDVFMQILALCTTMTQIYTATNCVNIISIIYIIVQRTQIFTYQFEYHLELFLANLNYLRRLGNALNEVANGRAHNLASFTKVHS